MPDCLRTAGSKANPVRHGNIIRSPRSVKHFWKNFAKRGKNWLKPSIKQLINHKHMNKTVTVNIGGIVFHIDENAYEKFKQYLESIRSHFTTADGRDEIMQDIEARIAEMFQERVKDSKQVITLGDVEEVTRQMGRPEEFGESGESREPEVEQASNEPSMPVKRRLFRNPDEKMLGGVCSGIANYFDIDIVWVRLAFVLLFFLYSTGFWFYIVLWIIIPEARTA